MGTRTTFREMDGCLSFMFSLCSWRCFYSFLIPRCSPSELLSSFPLSWDYRCNNGRGTWIPGERREGEGGKGRWTGKTSSLCFVVRRFCFYFYYVCLLHQLFLIFSPASSQNIPEILRFSASLPRTSTISYSGRKEGAVEEEFNFPWPSNLSQFFVSLPLGDESYKKETSRKGILEYFSINFSVPPFVTLL